MPKTTKSAETAKPARSRAANRMGTIRKRKDGRWEGRYTAPDGRQHSVYGKTQKAASEALRAATHNVDTGAWLLPSRMTVAQWIAEWLRNYCGHTAQSTRDFYEKLARLYINPAMGETRLNALTSAHVRRMVGDMGRRGLSPKTIRSASSTLRTALNAAVQARLISSNAAADVPLPRAQRTQLHIIDRPHIPAFIAAAQQTLFPDALVFLLQTGLRSGELRGLRWADVDFDASVIHVRRQLHTGLGGEISITPPKDGSRRDIIVGAETIDLLRRHRKRQAADKLRAGANWHNDPPCRDLVFRQADGRQLHDHHLQNAVAKVASAIDMPGLHPHDLRHSYAVAALRSGVDPKTVQHNLGHSSAAMTLDIYAAYTTDAGRDGAEKLSSYWRNAVN